MVTIFSLSVYMSFLAFAALGGAFFLFGRGMLYVFARYAKRDPLSIPIGAFIATVATAWALALGFVAADIWAITSKANQATSDERSAIVRLVGIADSPEIGAVPLREALMRYRTAVVDDEWIKNINLSPASSVEKSLQTIRDVILKMSRENIPTPIISHLLNDLDILQDARSMRLSVGATSVDSYKWYLVISLTIMTIITIASTHSDRIRAGRVALLIYTLSATLCLWILAIHANPYQGPAKLEPTVLLTSL
jgi:hypothetical protein